MRIHLPNSAFLGNIDAFLRRLDLSNPGELQVSANRKWLSLHPVVLAFCAAAAEDAEVTCEPFEAKSRHYLERMRLLERLHVPTASIAEHDPSGRFIPLTKVTNQEELSRFVVEMVPLLHLAPKEAAPIRYVVSELLRNVLEHADADAYVCAQYYARTNRISIGIADAGVGIRHTIARSHDAKTHLAAIKLALMPGITGATSREGGTEQNAGAGLFFIKSLAAVNRDFFVLYSGDALYKLLKSKAVSPRLNGDPSKDRHTEVEGLPSWHGTVVGIDLSLTPTTEFTTLLDAIRETYIATLRERKQRREPRFA